MHPYNEKHSKAAAILKRIWQEFHSIGAARIHSTQAHVLAPGSVAIINQPETTQPCLHTNTL